ncbi:hypothetical protein [Spirosoma aerophilum]
MKHLLLLLFLVTLPLQLAVAQKKQEIIIHDFENKPQTENWWRVNRNVTFSYDRVKENQLNKRSKTCLHVRWDSITSDKPFTWFTDLKADTLAADGMESTWKSFQQDTWLSFWCKGGEGDTLMLHYLVLSKGHSSKWGSTTMIPVVDKNWKFYKVRFADLHYQNWGKVSAAFNLKTDIGRCFEVGLRSGSVSKKGYIDAWFDNIKLSNYEPFN